MVQLRRQYREAPGNWKLETGFAGSSAVASTQAETSLSSTKHTTTEVIMRRLNEIVKLLKVMPLNSTILVLLFVVLGAFFAPTDSSAQAVPPRVQSLMINRPIVLPPEPPVQKQIRELRQDVKDNALEIEVQKAVGFWDKRCVELQRKLDVFSSNPYADPDIQALPTEQKANAIVNYKNALLRQIQECLRRSARLKAR